MTLIILLINRQIPKFKSKNGNLLFYRIANLDNATPALP